MSIYNHDDESGVIDSDGQWSATSETFRILVWQLQVQRMFPWSF